MTSPKYQTAIEIINEVIVPQIDTNAQDIKAIAKEVVDNAKDFDKKVEEVYNTLEAKDVETEGLFDTHKAGYTKYCDELKSQIERLATQITSDTSTQDIGKIVDELSTKIEALENEESFEYDDQELKNAVTKLNVDFSVFKEKVITSKSVIDEINSKEGIIEASSIKGLIQTLSNIANQGGNSNVKIAAPILEILSAGTSVMQGATRLNFIGSTVAYNNGTIDITNTGGSGSPGGSTTQLQYNNAGAFGGISGATTDGTVTTFASNGLKATNIVATTSAGFLIEGNSGTDVALFGAGGGAGATFYGGVNLNTMTQGSVLFAGASGLISQDNANLFWDDTNNRLKLGAYTDGTSNSPQTPLQVLGGSAVTTSITTSATQLRLARDGTASVSWPLSADFRLGKYAAAVNASTQLDIVLGNGGSVSPDTTVMSLQGNGNTGLLTTAPTHTLTLGSTSTGIALYNTADQTTNYERMHARWSSNIFLADVVSAGTGANRAFYLRNTATSGATADIRIERAASAHITATSGISSTGETCFRVAPTVSGTNTIPTSVVIAPSISQSSTAGYTALLINPTENTVGSGTKLLADFQVGGTSKFSVDNTGKIVSAVNTIQLSSASIARGGAHTLTLTTAGTTNATYPTGTITLVDLAATQTLTNKRITGRVQAVASAATVTPSWDNDDMVTITAQAAGLTLANPSGTPTSGQSLVIRIKDNGTAQTIAYGANYRAIGVTLPTTTVISKTLYLGGFWNAADSKFDITAYAIEA